MGGPHDHAAPGDASVLVDGGRIAAWFDTPARILAATDTSTALRSLDATERDRYAAFRFEPDRFAYLAAHTLHRQIWGNALGVTPHEVRINHDSNGRPTIIDPDGTAFFTSLSRRRGMVAVAISRESSVGVDVEEASARPEAMDLLARFLGPASYASVCLEIESDPSAFGRTWTLIEAFAKTRGDGLADSLKGIDVSAFGDGRYELTDARMRCLARSYSPDRAHCAAIAWQRRD
jgi:phosphopantetheinyl transferase